MKAEDTNFNPTHEFTLDNDERVLVRVEFLFDYVGYEQDGTVWYTVMGPEALWWSCRARGTTKVKAVVKLT